MHRMVTNYAGTVERMGVSFWGQHKSYFRRRNPAIIDEYQNHLWERVEETCIQSRPSSQWHGTIGYSIKQPLLEERPCRKHRRSERYYTPQTDGKTLKSCYGKNEGSSHSIECLVTDNREFS